MTMVSAALSLGRLRTNALLHRSFWGSSQSEIMSCRLSGSVVRDTFATGSVKRCADVRRLQQRFVTFSLISRAELAYDAKPGSPRTLESPGPKPGFSRFREGGRCQILIHIAADPALWDTQNPSRPGATRRTV